MEIGGWRRKRKAEGSGQKAGGGSEQFPAKRKGEANACPDLRFGEVVEDRGKEFSRFDQAELHDVPDVGMRVRTAAERKDVMPFAQIGGDDNLGFQVVGQNAARDLGRYTSLDKRQVRALGCLHILAPEHRRIARQFGWADDGNLAAEFALPIVAVPRALLRIRGEAMSHEFMGNAAIGDDVRGHHRVLDDRPMVAPDEHLDEFHIGIGRDAVFGLVAQPPREFDTA